MRLDLELRKADQLVLRPLLRYLRVKNFQQYVAECERTGKPPGLHVGCATLPLRDWYNCDLYTRSPVVINYVDATAPLPFPDHGFQHVFSEHFIEHLTLEAGERFFREAYRVLQPGGVIRTATPDLQFVLDLHELKTPLHVRYVEWLVATFLPGQPADPAIAINHLFRGWGHRFLYDARTLERVLREAGFREFRRFQSGASDHPALRGLERHGLAVPPEFNELETFVLEATK